MHKTILLKVVTELTVPIINPFYLNNLPEGKLTVNFPALLGTVEEERSRRAKRLSTRKMPRRQGTLRRGTPRGRTEGVFHLTWLCDTIDGPM
jgi:hypothetical protein